MTQTQMNINSVTNDKSSLKDYIKEMVYQSNKIDMIVSFTQLSGVVLLEEEFKFIERNNIPIRILTSTYMNITQPAALYYLKSIFGDSCELRFFDDNTISFHPKAYFFYTAQDDYVFVGSSNLSKSALTNGVEWNYRLSYENDPMAFQNYKDQFDFIYKNRSYVATDEVLKAYSKNWRRPKVNLFPENESEGKVENLFKPNEAQIEALYEIKRIRDEGADRAVVIADTGLGKTYLAAFDSRNFNKILFVAHREEILKQAYNTYYSLGYRSLGILDGSNKDFHKDIVFANIMTLNKDDNLKRYAKDHFDYFILDEFHHSAADSYRKVFDYFTPEFTLGLTATPYRMDDQDVLAMMDYNIAYESDLFSSINKGWLVPFYYYGIYDNTVDYGKITYLAGKYNTKELEKELSINNRADLVLKNYIKYRNNRTLGFCTSIKHAEFMAEYFNKNKINAVAVHSEGNNRQQAIDDLRSKKIDVIFSVDMFNEGLDVKELDMVMFLRPTESPTVFLQQLGRGLRLYEDKDHLTVLDFIGNFKKVSLLPYLLSGRNRQDYFEHKINIKKIREETFYPDGCRIDFDFEVISLFEKFNTESTKLGDLIDEEYNRIKDELQHYPTRTEYFIHMDNDLYLNMKSKRKFNVFKDYITFQNRQKKEKLNFTDTVAHDFIKMIEATSMSKLYKLPIFLAFYNNGSMKATIDEDDIYNAFQSFYANPQNRLDMVKDKSTKDYENWKKKQYIDLAFRNPIHFLNKTHGNFFSIENKTFKLSERLMPYINDEDFMKNMKDAIEFRRMEFLRVRKT